MGTSPGGILGLAIGIAGQEGYGVSPTNRPTRNNNPGDLRGFGGCPTDAGGFCIFPSPAAGAAALVQDLLTAQSKRPGQTIAQFIGGDAATGWPGYAPAADGNNPGAYAAAVAARLGVTPDTTLGALAAPDVAVAMGQVPPPSPPLVEPVAAATDTAAAAVTAATAATAFDASAYSAPSLLGGGPWGLVAALGGLVLAYLALT